MPKVVILIKRKAGMTAEEFRQYYETHHAPLATRLVGHCFADYRRNYINALLPVGLNADGAGVLDFDVITEIWVKDAVALDEMFRIAASPEVAEEIARDEENFVDRASVRMMVVEETRPGV